MRAELCELLQKGNRKSGGWKEKERKQTMGESFKDPKSDKTRTVLELSAILKRSCRQVRQGKPSS